MPQENYDNFSFEEYPLKSTDNPLDSDNKSGVNTELSQDLKLKVIAHRNGFYRMIKARYQEIIINMRNYSGLPNSINKYKVENMLRNSQQPIIGQNALGVHCVLGINANTFSTSDPANYLSFTPLTGASIQWLIPSELKPKNWRELKEITELDNAETGDFIVLRNKPISYVNDYALIDFYAKELAETVASRYSLIIQSKLSKVIQSEIGDETTNQMIADLYNGAPFIKMSQLFDPDNIIDIGNERGAELLKQNEETYNIILKELNNHLAIDSAGVNKLSGVSDSEVASNDDFIGANANMYLDGIQPAFDMYNHRFQTNFKVFFANQPASDTNALISKKLGDKRDE